MASFAVRRSFNPKRNTPKRWDRTFIACDRCGLMFRRSELRRQRGLLVDEGCYDEPDNGRRLS